MDNEKVMEVLDTLTDIRCLEDKYFEENDMENNKKYHIQLTSMIMCLDMLGINVVYDYHIERYKVL